jgi:N-acetylmuramic acid 6-phosphate etherase
LGTESRNPRSYGLDKMSAREIVRLMNEEEQSVMRALKSAEESLAIVAERVSETFLNGGRVIYIGAGTSGRMAAMDAAEMPPTFGIESDRFIALLPGGVDAMARAIEDAEDDEYAPVAALNALMVDRNDTVVGMAASGRTPFVVAGIRHARQKGLWTCGIANNQSTPLLEAADLGILLDTGPEILTGSTRLKAGTAQKLAVNRISTAAMVLSGKVIENLMVDVKPKNQKLKERCARIVTELSDKTFDEAWLLLETNDWKVRDVLVLVGSRNSKDSSPLSKTLNFVHALSHKGT